MLCVAYYDSVSVVLVESQVTGLIPIINDLNLMGRYLTTGKPYSRFQNVCPNFK